MQASAAGRPSDWSSWHVYGRADRPVDRAFALHCRCRFRADTRAIAKQCKVGAPPWGDGRRSLGGSPTASVASSTTAMRRRAASQWRFCRRKGGLSLRRSLHWPALVEIKDGRRAAATPLCVLLTQHADTRAKIPPLGPGYSARGARATIRLPSPTSTAAADASRCRLTRRVLAIESESHCLSVGWSPFPTLSKPSTLLPRWIPQPIRWAACSRRLHLPSTTKIYSVDSAGGSR